MAQSQNQVTRILFLLDASGSMYAKMDNDIRMNVAKRLLSKMVDSLQSVPNLELALRVYGHQTPKYRRDCQDTKLEVGFDHNNHDLIKRKIMSLVPKGNTPIAYSLTKAAYDFPTQPNVRNIIILITDGIEECDGDPCVVSEALQKQGIILRPFVIGIGGNADFSTAFDCVGKYYDAQTEGAFENILGIVISQALNSTTVQVNLLDNRSRATETNVNMTFYNHRNGSILYNYYHTMNDRGVPDTILLEPTYVYDLQVHTTPPVIKTDISILPSRHNIIAVDAPQGDLELKLEGLTNYLRVPAIVRKSGKLETIHVQELNTTHRYLLGKYDLEILTLPRIYIKDVKIEQSTTTTVTLPQPGKLQIISSQDYEGSIYQYNNTRMDWVCRIDNKSRRQAIVLQPGKYRLITRLARSTSSGSTNERTFDIQSGGSTVINLQ